MANKISGAKVTVQTPLVQAVANGSAMPQDSDFEDIGASRGDNFEINSTVIDVTTKGSNEDMEILDERGIKSRNLTLEGLLEDSDIAKALEQNAENNKLRWFRITREGDGVTYTARFKIANYSFNSNYDEAVPFNLTLNSSGVVTRTQP